MLSQYVANCSVIMDSTQCWLDLSGRRTWIPFIYLSVQGDDLDVKLCYACQSSWENLGVMKLFRKSRKSKALSMHLALYSNDIKIYCGWMVTFKASQSYIYLIIIICTSVYIHY